MQFVTSRSEALDKLNKFIENDISNYNTKRNFDFGAINRSNVSCLSPYITHRLITEYETAKLVLKKHPFQKVDKFIQEIFWRVYWKGWLELRPKVWNDFIDDLKIIKEDDEYLKAINGETEIVCFNDWINELKNFNYLHNHTRMLFASIWIFTLRLPWQKGAEFFMKHLYDGDAASNTLSWRWVAGIQTKGKNYLAQSWNISKFTNNKYKNVKINEIALPIIDKREYKISPIKINNNEELNKHLIIFENEMFINFNEIKKYKKIFFVLISNESRSLKLSKKVLDFKKSIINSQLNDIKYEAELLDENSFINFTLTFKSFDVIYPSIGENLSFLKRLIKKNHLKINYITRKEDEFCWRFSNKGYFNFKSNLPIILSTFKLN
ncbi:MAG: DNA photolyase [Candidatus Pelagibacter sp. TMED197]|nr:DNA photolyase [Candidatus Pelagibacter sp.]OUW58759.1 MAG: DNA photolyase [Candidatus Pelagibacter sp. TMED197]